MTWQNASVGARGGAHADRQGDNDRVHARIVTQPAPTQKPVLIAAGGRPRELIGGTGVC